MTRTCCMDAVRSRWRRIVGCRQDLFVIANHFQTSGGDPLSICRNQTPPPRAKPSARKRGGVSKVRRRDLAAIPGARVVVLGDMNDFQFSPPLCTLNWGQQPAQPGRDAARKRALHYVPRATPRRRSHPVIDACSSRAYDSSCGRRVATPTSDHEPPVGVLSFPRRALDLDCHTSLTRDRRR